MSEFGFSGEGEKLTPSEELAHLLDTYGGVESIPSDIKERILAEMKQYGDTRSCFKLFLFIFYLSFPFFFLYMRGNIFCRIIKVP